MSGGNLWHNLAMADQAEFEFRGINHIALVCRDMAKTVDFYTNVLGMPLIKTLEIPGGAQHFFFDCGGGNSVAFFWFPETSPAAPGVSSPAEVPGPGADWLTSHGSMNHLAFDVPAEKFDEYVQRLKDKGLEPSGVLNHDDSDTTTSAEVHPGVFVRSVYFKDPDGIVLEFACWTKEFGPGDALHAPATADGRRTQPAAL